MGSHHNTGTKLSSIAGDIGVLHIHQPSLPTFVDGESISGLAPLQFLVVCAVPSLRKLVLAFRGSQSMVDAAIDIACIPLALQPPFGCVSVHGGMQAVLSMGASELDRCICQVADLTLFVDWDWVCTGHSLGGGYTSIAPLVVPALREKVFRDD